MRLLDVVRRALDDDSLDYEVLAGDTPGDNTAGFELHGRATLYVVLAMVDEDLERVTVLVVSTQRVPVTTRPAVAEYLMRASWGSTLASFDLDFDDGEFRCRATIDVEGGTLVPEQVRTLVWTAYHQMERVHAGALTVAFGGASPLEALEVSRAAAVAADESDDENDAAEEWKYGASAASGAAAERRDADTTHVERENAEPGLGAPRNRPGDPGRLHRRRRFRAP